MVEAAAEVPDRIEGGRPPLDRILDLVPLDDDVFEGRSYTDAERLYGGQAIAQAIIAAGRTVDADRHPHSVHANFLHPGNTTTPVVYRVDRVRDGRSFTTRNVAAEQNGKTIFELAASFQVAEDGLSHQPEPPTVAAPEDLPDLLANVTDEQKARLEWLRNYERHIAIDFRIPGEDYPRLVSRSSEPREPYQVAWVRAAQRLSDDPLVHAGAWGYISDMFLISTALLPHAVPMDANRTQVASLDHAIWFHAPFRADEWHLYEQEGIWTGGGRGLSRGSLYSRDGRLVATTMQEGLLRVR
ncbi:thioesterase family protein [Aldersonia sp. NBC_00410]|uniref:acyl-CoA thioesterase n=1 Tax=Aldersonia sp. NBC_00410 TaxID=2975954 RepID=UPI00224F2AF9|nr:acyl-CoA thioesterase domain-containing protein [Aldersonia sp. NBC_00410]MCX5041880.1 thioesterase family protein [Aldersonia sp. NBC_00410]